MLPVSKFKGIYSETHHSENVERQKDNVLKAARENSSSHVREPQ